MTTRSERLLRAESVTAGYPGGFALRDVTLGVRPGSMLALVGPNGSGKTTTLRVLSGALRPEAGSATLDGAPLHTLSPRVRAQRVAVVPQHADAGLLFSVQALVSMGRTPHGGLFGVRNDHDRQAVRAALASADLEHLQNRRFADLSGGEQQRVMVGMALAQQADYLLFDEPTVHLDLEHQHTLLELLVRLRDGGHGIACVMHDLSLAGLYFDEVALFQAGRLVGVGTPESILRDPACLSVFRAPVSVVPHPQTGAPQVLLDRSSG